jgi:hypothetical protein
VAYDDDGLTLDDLTGIGEPRLQPTVTVLYAKELREAGAKVNAVSPGYRATELNGGLPTPGAGDPAGGAAVAVTMALMDEDGPTGEFHSDTGAIDPW